MTRWWWIASSLTQNANNCNKCNRLPTPVQPKPMQLGRQPTSLIGVLQETKFRYQIYCECECQGYVLIPNLDIVLHLCLWMRPEFMCPGFLQGLSKVSQGFLKGCLKDLKTGHIQAYFYWLCYVPMTRTGRGNITQLPVQNIFLNFLLPWDEAPWFRGGGKGILNP